MIRYSVFIFTLERIHYINLVSLNSNLEIGLLVVCPRCIVLHLRVYGVIKGSLTLYFIHNVEKWPNIL